jgi:hypothetical protein
VIVPVVRGVDFSSSVLAERHLLPMRGALGGGMGQSTNQNTYTPTLLSRTLSWVRGKTKTTWTRWRFPLCKGDLG